MDSKNNEKLFQEKSNRIFFLKAILLGIQYSDSGQGESLKMVIQEELNRLLAAEKNNNDSHSKVSSSNHSIQSNIHLNQNQNNQSNTLSKDELIHNAQITLQKYEQKLHELNSQKNMLSNQISNMGSQSYTKTLSFQQGQQLQKNMTELKKYYLIICKEIEKYSLLHQSVFKMIHQTKISSQENIMKKNNVKNFVNPSYNNQISQQQPNNFNQEPSEQPFFYKKNSQNTPSQTTNLLKPKSVSFFPPDNVIDSEESNSPSSNFNTHDSSESNISSDNTNSNNDDDENSNNLLKELQKTFGNLSSLLNP